MPDFRCSHCCCIAAVPVGAQVTYPAVVPGVELQFPRDEGAHPQFRIEWWYVTGWVQDDTGAPLGLQVTFFRVRPGLGESNPSRFAARQVLFGHAAVADPRHGKLRHAERSAREGFDIAFARDGRVDVRLDDWSLRAEGGGYRAIVAGDDFSMQLELEPTQPPLLQGDRGYSRKGPEAAQASHYYSLPHLRVSGEIVIDGKRRNVTGAAWFDHEWSSDVMDDQARGWDWLGRQPRRWRRADGVPHARPGRRRALGGGDAAGSGWQRTDVRTDGSRLDAVAALALTAHRRRVSRGVAGARG